LERMDLSSLTRSIHSGKAHNFQTAPIRRDFVPDAAKIGV
jgi:hypothetical protein